MQSRSICQIDDGGDCTIGAFSEVFVYHQCSLITGFTVIKCPTSITVTNLYFIETGDCSAWEEELSIAYTGQNGEAAVGQLFDDRAKFLAESAQAFVLAKELANPNSPYKCTDCGTSNMPFSINFHNEGCYSICSQFIENGEDGGTWLLEETICGNSCCKKSTPFCILPNKTICYGTPTRESAGDCEPVLIKCPEGSNLPPSRNCRHSCNRV